MMLLDSSVVVPVTRGKGDDKLKRLVDAIGTEDFYLSRFTELELLQGARDGADWARLVGFLDAQEFIGLQDNGWRDAAAIYFELRRKGVTVGSVIDCCIAQTAMERGLILVHDDGDFEQILTVRPLKLLRVRVV